jgi:hypothetical protein
MSLTRSQVETILVKRAGKRMAFVEMDNTTVDGTNEDLADPISTALLAMDITPADISDPADSDLEDVDNPNEFLDRAELRLLENILGNSDAVDITEGPRSERYSQFMTLLETAIARKKKQVEDDYGELEGLSTGLVSHNFQTKGDDEWL